ncbi:RNA polymerase sigma factor, sigma-70 family [Catalinimonas alkaloidigena]|uniref:RNA polymerase sigma factor, sigma-70 family n=1 Tax=Catalinimonas alkaloidigena TaxID=1075417 RepID=A0A1G9NI12_9BACT|nr:sigma-70 family RNA polymerase sigma factor [Catalinimonas alkaloidigena]SDL86089.1 RNA polymerase sigma factor, sigma-70 family [Catalinimonas alkaloidigena]
MAAHHHTAAEELHLWQQFRAGQRAALAQLFHTYYKSLYNYGLKIIQDDALVEDAIQEMFLDLWRGRQKLSGEIRSVKLYLIISFRRTLLRRKSRFQVFASRQPVETLHGLAPSGEEVLIRNQTDAYREQLVRQELIALPQRQREVIHLRFYQELSFDEIADLMQMNVQSVRNLLFRALTRLRKNQTLHDQLSSSLLSLPLLLSGLLLG